MLVSYKASKSCHGRHTKAKAVRRTFCGSTSEFLYVSVACSTGSARCWQPGPDNRTSC